MRRFALALAVLASAPLGGLRAQDPDDERQKNTALVRVHPQLDLLVVKADALVREGKYAEALSIYAEAEKHPNHVVPLGGTVLSSPTFLGVQEYCVRKVGQWPEEGKAAYRSWVDPLAAQAFRRARDARDLAVLAECARRWPWSSYAGPALALLGALHLEAGRPSAAVTALERALESIAEAGRPAVAARLGTAYAAAGLPGRLELLARRTARDLPGATILAGDRDVPLADHLAALAKSAADSPPTMPEPVASWEMAQGFPSGVRLAEAVEPGPPVWSATLPATPFDAEEDPWMRGRGAGPTASYLPVVPAVADGLVYAHTDYAVWAWNLYAGATDLQWTHRLESPPGDLMFEDRILHATTVHEGRVYANLVTALGSHEVQMNYIRVKFPFPRRALFCLDAYTGRVLWRLGGHKRGERFEDGLTFATPPTPHEGRLYVGAIRQDNPTDPFQHYVLCLDPATGRVLWSTFVASGGTEINLFGNSTRESLGGPVAIEGDGLYYCTNHGAIAALDRATGRLVWLYRYQQIPVNPTRRIDIRRNALEWLPAAPIVAQGTVHVTPADSRSLLALDAHSGEKRWEKPRGDHRLMAGSDGTRLVLAGEGVEWYEIATQGKFLGRFDPPNGRGSGRPAVAVDGVWFPTTQGLYKASWPEKGGLVKSRFEPWNNPRLEGANVVVAEGSVVIAATDLIEARFNRRDLERLVEIELAKSPDDPAVAYRSALKLLQSGKQDRALDLFERVVRRTAGSPRASDLRMGAAARKRLFAVAMESARNALSGGRPEEARRLFLRARDAAPDPASWIDAAAGAADAALARKDFPSAVAEFQQLLRDQGGDRRVFDLARGRLAAILEGGGRDAYAAFDREAARRLEAARKSGSTEAYLDVFQSFPNSASAETAVLEGARAADAAGRPEQAASALRLFLREFPSSPRLLDAQVSLVTLLEKRRLFGAAAGVLRRMMRAGPDRPLSVDGLATTVRAFAESRLSREEYRSAAGGQAPVRLSVPLKARGVHVDRDFPGGGAVLRPEGPPLVRGAGLVLLNYGQTLKAVDPETGAEAWRFAAGAPIRGAFSADDALLVATDAAVARVHPATGAVEWRHEPGGALKGFCLAGPALCFLAADPARGHASSLCAIDPSRGTALWTQPYDGGAVTPLLGADDNVALVTQQPNRVHLFEAETGRRVASTPVQQHSAGLRLIGAADGLLVTAGDGNLYECTDLSAGTLKWRRPLDRSTIRCWGFSRAGVFLAGKRSGDEFALVIDLKSGKLRAYAERLDWPDRTDGRVPMDDARVVIASRIDDRTTVVRALDPADPALKELWSVRLEDEVLAVPPQLTASHTVVMRVRRVDGGKFTWSADVLDARGKAVQNMSGADPVERSPSCAPTNDALLLFVENRVEFHK